MPTGKSIRDLFTRPVMACFRKPNESDVDIKIFIRLLEEELEVFQEEDVAQAAKEIIRTRKDPFMPTIAECVEACKAILRKRAAIEGEAKLVAALEKCRLDDEELERKREEKRALAVAARNQKHPDYEAY